MAAGGNAADGAVASNAVLGVVLPDTCGPGGDLFALVHQPDTAAPAALNGSGRAGSNASARALRDAGFEEMPKRHPYAITVPGCIDGWIALLDRHGSLTLSDVLQPAIALAEDGFPVSPELARSLLAYRELLAAQGSAASLYPDGKPPQPGSTLRRPAMAETLRVLAAGGRSAFYEGRVGEAIVAATAGTITPEDLTVDQAMWIDPLGLSIFGRTAWTTPPNSQGYITLAAAWVLERLGPPADATDPAFHHAVIEAYRAFAWERNDVVADPDHLPWELSEYLASERLEQRLQAVVPKAVADWPEPTPGPAGTAYFCAIDADGMAVSCIQSNYFGIGSRISAGSTGVFLHNRAAGFSVIAGHPNEAGPGKRPLHTLAPTLWTRGDEPALILGTRGGDQQPQYLAQMVAAMLIAELDPTEAQALPRWSIEGTDEGHVVVVESGMPEQVVTGLGARGHAIVPGPASTPGWGPVSVIAIDADGNRSAAADPRVSTATAAGE